ncbi:integrase, catalytic region, zinc finger, CCHC-type containing protein [Tanacetum coccineum]
MGGETSETELLYLTEYLNTIIFPGFLPHELELKVGSPIMLLRNVNLAGGLCNDTRMIVRCLMSKLPRNMSQHTIAALRIGQDNCILEARVYQKWNSKNISDMKELAFCYILIDREGANKFVAEDILDIKTAVETHTTGSATSSKESTSIDKGTSGTVLDTHPTKGTNEPIKEETQTPELEAEVDQNVVNRKYDEIEQKNLIITNDKLIDDCLSKEVFYIATNFELTVSRFTEMHDAHTVVQARYLELKAELSKLHDKVQKDDHNELVKHFSNLEVNHLNLQLKYHNLKESFGNNTSLPARDAPDFDSVFTRSEAYRTLDFRALDFQITQLTEKVTVLQEQNKLFKVENPKIKQHYKELYDSIKITHAKHIEQTTVLLTENKSLKAQIHENLKCNTMDSIKPKFLAPGRYVIDVEPIPPRNRNNREVYLDYLKHLKESVETLREIVKEAKVNRPLNKSLSSACLYTKHSQELLEYVIGTCLKDVNKQDEKHDTTPLTRKKQVTFEDQCETSNNNTHKHVEKLNIQKTNVPVIPSTRVNSCTDASGLQPKSNTKKNRISPPKRVNKKKVEEHPRTNKSSLKTTNHVDSSISSKRTVINSNSHSICRIDHPLVFGLRLLKTYDGGSLIAQEFHEKFIWTVRFGNDHFGSIMGYVYYVIGDSVISKVYYVKGLGHNLFYVRQFYDSDMKVAFRKHSCYVRDTDSVEIIKGSYGSNLYTISVEDMMKSSPICLLSKTSKNKSWLWHRHLNHLNFGTINDLARKDLVRGLPRLKFEKDHLCFAR